MINETVKAKAKIEYSEGWGSVYVTYAFDTNKEMMNFVDEYIAKNDGRQFGGCLYAPRTIWKVKMTYVSGKSYTKKVH